MESRWRNSHELVYHGPLLNPPFGSGDRHLLSPQVLLTNGVACIEGHEVHLSLLSEGVLHLTEISLYLVRFWMKEEDLYIDINVRHVMTGGYRWCFCVCVFFFGAPWEVWRCMFGFPFRNLSFHFLMGQKTNFGVFFSLAWTQKNQQSLPMHIRHFDYTHSTYLDCLKSSEVQGTIQRLKIGSFNINMFPISGCNPLQDTKTPMSLTSMRSTALVPLHWKSFNIYELRMFGRRSKFAGWLRWHGIHVHLYEFGSLWNPSRSQHKIGLSYQLSEI